ncbi:MAG: hypothetical protein KF819_19705 [Labilithrix sp.]|nr:hypothetical protein [Labilithrix sp.]
MSVSPPWVPKSPGTKVAEAVIVDDAGGVVARRTVTDHSTSCVALARAIGAWATLVVDAELARAKEEAPPARSGNPPVWGFAPAPPVQAVSAPEPAPESDTPALAPDDTPPSLERSIAIELGSMVYLRNGVSATGGVAGLAPFVTIEVAKGWVLRPSAYFGRSTGDVPLGPAGAASLSHIGARADFCRRIPGNYIERRGVSLDLCAGVDAALLISDAIGGSGPSGRAGRVGVGPGAVLRGELGAGLALELRSLFGANLTRAPILEEGEATVVYAAGELGVSVRLP